MKHFLLFLTLTLLPAAAAGQSLDSLLRDIEKNNLELQALRQAGATDIQEVRSQNRLEGPSVEYSPFFRRGAGGMASSELVVSQGFDFPTLYAARRKHGRLQQAAMEWQYAASRRDLLLQAKQLCLDLIRLNREKDLLDERQSYATRLLALYEKRMAAGDATQIELNKIRMDQMSLGTETAQNERLRTSALRELQRLNGGKAVSLDTRAFPPAPSATDFAALRDRLLAADPGVQAADAAVSASRQEVKVNRQGWIPRLELGYRRNTDQSEASHGLLIGASIPLFSNRDKVKTARLRLTEAELRRDDARLQAATDLQARFDELRQLRREADAYDTQLMRQSLTTLRKAVEEGGLSVMDFYTETDNVYRNLQERLRLETEYQKVLAELYRNDL